MRDGVFDVSDLMASNRRCSTQRVLLIVALAVFAVALVAVAVVAYVSTNEEHYPPRNDSLGAPGILLNEWLNGSLSTKNFNGSWLSDDEILYQDNDGNLLLFNVSARTGRSVFEVAKSANAASFDHWFSADRKYLLLAFYYQRLFRHTFLAQYKIINLETKNETMLRASEHLQLVVWAPQGNSLAYVYQSNIYYRPRAESDKEYQITHSGAFGSIYNGVPDWVYEEEIFSSNKALWFSPNGSRLAFGYFDDSHTPIMNIPYYGFSGPQFQYPSAIPVHYPKSGVLNPLAKLFYVDLELALKGNVKLTEIEPPPPLVYVDRVLASVSFPTNSIVAATWMNRVQNRAYFRMCNVDHHNCSTALDYRERNGWVEQFVPPLFSKDASAFLLILPQNQSEGGAWRHVTMVTNATTNSPKSMALTSGHFVVTEIVAWDEENNFVYYLATNETDSAQKHLYRVTIDHLNGHQVTCLSCGITSESDGNPCLYNSAEFSTDSSHYVLTCAGPGIPQITVHDRNSTRLFTWEKNEEVAGIIEGRSLPVTKKLSVPLPGGFEAKVKMLLPPNADLSGRTKYPMLVYVYGGPDTNEVTDKFSLDWGTYLVTNRSVIYTSIDGRGSGLNGNDLMFAVYRNLGTVEVEDQLNVTRYLQDEFAYIDRARTAIWGWSYGGYTTGMALAIDYTGVFKCGMSVAPVTDWTLYDSIYTERFMGLPNPTDNLAGYNRSLLNNKIDNFKNKKFYLIHGTLDDNVHFQQSLLLAKMLELKDILFQQQTYTDETHDIARMRLHLYHSMGKFLDDCFAKSER